jgi:hypothetical protein
MTHLPILLSLYYIAHTHTLILLFRRKNLCSPPADSIRGVLYRVTVFHASQTKKFIVTLDEPNFGQVDTKD